MAYLANSSVYAFPVANRAGSLTSSLSTEYNLVNIVMRLTSQKSFVISDEVDRRSPDSYFEFCIKGYYFRVPTVALLDLREGASPLLDSVGDTLYATLQQTASPLNWVNELGPQVDTTESGAGNEDSFTALVFSNSKANADLALVKLTGSNTYTIPPESLVRMCTDGGHRYVTIDDGDWDAT